MDGEDGAHRHEAEAQEEHAVEPRLDGGHGEDARDQGREERDRRDEVEVLVRDDDQRAAPRDPQRHEAGRHQEEGRDHQESRELDRGASCGWGAGQRGGDDLSGQFLRPSSPPHTPAGYAM